MLDRLATLAHGFGVRIETLLYGLEQMLVFPSCDASLGPFRALRFERALQTCRRPVAPKNLAILLVRVAIGEPLASRTSIDVPVGEVDEVLLAKTAVRFRAPTSSASAASP
jgi:hypothetical protein